MEQYFCYLKEHLTRTEVKKSNLYKENSIQSINMNNLTAKWSKVNICLVYLESKLNNKIRNKN